MPCAIRQSLLVATFNLLDRDTHAFSECTVIEDLGDLLATTVGIPVQLIPAVSAVVHTHRLQLAVHFDQQDN
jgi:hypothetical protein